jgi:hypothetical protein
MTVTVTQEMIDAGIKCSPNRCPLALAMKYIYPRVSMGISEWRTDTHAYWYLTPAEAARFIIDFDRGFPVSPQSFEFPDPEVTA